MPDIEDSLRRYADALERSATARVDAPPHRQRGLLVACAAAFAVVAIASTAVLMTRGDHPSRVSTIAPSAEPGPFPFPVRCPDAKQDGDFEVFMRPRATSTEVAAVRSALRSDAGVRQFRFLSHADAYREFTRLFRGQSGLITSTSAADLPESFRVKSRSARSSQRTKRRLTPFAGVDEVNLPSDCGRSLKLPTPLDPNVWVTATVKLDKKTFIQGEDVTGEITFTNHLPTDAVITDATGCLQKWGVGIAPGRLRIDVYQTSECRSGPTFAVPTGTYLAFRPGITRVPLRIAGTFQSCTGSDSTTPGTPRCRANGRMPNLPVGRARIQLVVDGSSGRVTAPGPIPIRVVPRGSRPPFCRGAQISVRETEVSLASGSGRATFATTNVSRRPCTLDGYPEIGIDSDLVTTTERYSQIMSDHGDSFLMPRVRSRPVAVPPGGTASFSVGYSTRSAANDSGNDPGNCSRKLTTLPTRLPDSRDLVDVRTTMEPCPGTPVGADAGLVAVTVSPFVAGSRGVHR